LNLVGNIMKSSCLSSQSISLVRMLGIVNKFQPTFQKENGNPGSLFPLAKKNKIALLFLKTIATFGKYPEINNSLLQYEEKNKSFLDLTTFVSNLFEKKKVSYSLFKTLKPFPSTPSDIDVLFWSKRELERAIALLENNGCISLEKSDYGLTMFSPKHKLNIDLTTQVAVSGFIYVDKEAIFKHVKTLQVSGTTVQTLEPEVDLLVIAAHSLFKEQLYTLNDYYSFVLSAQSWEKAIELSDSFHLKQSLNVVLETTIGITASAFGSLNPIETEIGHKVLLNRFGLDCHKLEFPKKYALGTIGTAYQNKIRTDAVSQKSLLRVVRLAAKPELYHRIVQHVIRKTY
jgi:putative nucleotidyltransferase-like protein